jgi:tetratricopeptide (TPR) repeat protein
MDDGWFALKEAKLYTRARSRPKLYMKALFGLGYTLVEAGRPDEAYDALRRYTELTPSNAWAWFWLGRACVDMGAADEARSAFERALACEEEGSFETDAREYLEELSS